MKKNNMISEFLSKETEEEKEKRFQSRKDEIYKRSESYYLGYLVGEKISRRLPILSTSGIKGNIPIQIQELDHYNNLTDDWFNERDETKRTKLWKVMCGYSRMLEDKYLPKEFVTRTSVMNISDMNDFNLGVRSALWDSDFCYYDIEKNEDVEITIEDDYYFMKYKFKR
jgi:hypothetical protein